MPTETKRRSKIDRMDVVKSQLAREVPRFFRRPRGPLDHSAIARRAMNLCEPCRGIPEMSINRCPMCRVLQEALG